MKFLDALLGRNRPAKSRLEPLFALTTAYPAFTANADLSPSGFAGICFRPVISSQFQQTEMELRELAGIGAQATNTSVEFVTDDQGFRWVVLRDDAFEDLVAMLHMVSRTLEEHGFAEQLLAAAFRFTHTGTPVYWIYNYKRGTFYPVVVTGEHTRDNTEELRLRAVLEKELPIEPQITRWYPLWGMPF